MGRAIFARPVAALIHPAEKYDHTVAQGRKPPDLRRIERALSGVRPCRKDGRQEIYRGPGAVRLMDFLRIMDRRAAQ